MLGEEDTEGTDAGRAEDIKRKDEPTEDECRDLRTTAFKVHHTDVEQFLTQRLAACHGFTDKRIQIRDKYHKGNNQGPVYTFKRPFFEH